MSDTSTEVQRDLIYQDLVDRALDAEGPVTDVEGADEKRTVVRAAQARGDSVYRADITLDRRGEKGPRVSFARAVPDADVQVVREWTKLAVGGLTGPQRLGRWEALFDVFNAAVETFQQEVDAR